MIIINSKEIVKWLLSEKNPIAIRRRKKMRENLINTTPTFLCPNCIGGILFHDLGIEFQSPTINLMMLQTDFVRFILELDYYLSQNLIFFRHPEYDFPCAHLGDIILHFTHYHSEKEAMQKWFERSSRIDRNNCFVFLEERDGLTREEILRLGDIRVRGLVVFTATAYPDIPWTLQIPKYKSDGEIGNILAKSYWNDSREYERYFDFVKWFNEADGDFNVKPFVK